MPITASQHEHCNESNATGMELNRRLIRTICYDVDCLEAKTFKQREFVDRMFVSSHVEGSALTSKMHDGKDGEFE